MKIPTEDFTDLTVAISDTYGKRYFNIFSPVSGIMFPKGVGSLGALGVSESQNHELYRVIISNCIL